MIAPDRIFYQGRRLPGFADLSLTYWFEKAREQIENGQSVKRAGLLATNSIRGGANRESTKQRIKETGDIFMAWSDRDWMLDGAAVRVSMVGFDKAWAREAKSVGWVACTENVNPDLTATVDITLS